MIHKVAICLILISTSLQASVCRQKAALVGVLAVSGIAAILQATAPDNNPRRDWDPSLIPQSCLVEKDIPDRIGRTRWVVVGSSVLVTSRQILTAGHIFGANHSGRYRVTCPGREPIAIESIEFLPEYLDASQAGRLAVGFDLAVATLKRSPNIEPIRLSQTALRGYEEFRGSYFGFGQVGNRKKGDYHSFPIRVWSQRVQGRYLLIGEGEKHDADSGGPFIIIDSDGQPTLLGLLTHATENHPISTYLIFSSTGTHIDWIQRHLTP